jgi:hypothetical protein
MQCWPSKEKRCGERPLHARERLPPEVGDRLPGAAVASPSSTKRPNISSVKPCANKTDSVHPCGEPSSSLSARFCSALRPPFRGLTAWTPLRLARAGCSRQFGRASPPIIPHFVHTMRGPNVGTGTSSGQRSALSTAWWWHTQQHTSSDRTPLARMLPSVIGSIGSLMRLAVIRRIVGRPGAGTRSHLRRRRPQPPCRKGWGRKADFAWGRRRPSGGQVYREPCLRRRDTRPRRYDGGVWFGDSHHSQSECRLLSRLGPPLMTARM